LEVETLRASNRIKDEAIARLEDAARGARQALVNIQRDLGVCDADESPQSCFLDVLASV
jgi:hypothetical protein